MNLEQRIDLLAGLGAYCKSANPALETAKHRAHIENGWFTPEFIDLALTQIAEEFLQKDLLTAWTKTYNLPPNPPVQKTIGLIMAGNIPMVGFHDLLCIFISGHRQHIKASSRDGSLVKHLVGWMTARQPEAAEYIQFAERLNGCDAYIATGSNNSARYFDYYFGKYPSIIRRNRTSVALLNGQESAAHLEALADDVNQYFGLGCRNVTQIYVPENYDFVPLLDAFKKYQHLADLAKYKHNYDYQLTLLILNKKYYMTNGTILLTENESPFSPISVLHYQYYRPGALPPALIQNGENAEIQCVVGQPIPAAANPNNATPDTASQPPAVIPFGQAQRPRLEDYADGVDTLQFLRDL
ncbi:MAG: acyl-CoA reductase [Bacteroidetes bacterium]|nr:acyl-CoA reductase [Bacteroidota bacterium]